MDTEAPIQVAQLNINNNNFPVYQGVNTVGRNRQAIINIIHMNISQNHAIIVTLQDNHYISDLKSSNGTFVDGTKLKPFQLYPLSHYANIILGTLNGTYICQGDFCTTTYLNISLETQSFYNKNTQLLEVTQSMDLHDAPTQRISWAKPLTNCKELPADPKTIVKKSIGANDKSLTLPEIDQCNNENLPLLTNNENFMELNNVSKPIEEDEETEIMTIERPSCPVFVEEDNELTDCEEDEKCSEALTPVKQHAIREESNDSLQFLNSENSVIKTELKNDFKIIDSNGSGSFITSQSVQQKPEEQHSSDDSDSPIVARTARKCGHIISTPDFLDSNNIKKSSAEQEHTVLANESRSKTQLYNISIPAAESSMFDVSIPATQDKLWWNDSDCIPATQDVSVLPKRESQNRAKSSQLSEENFKLGLTQLIDSSANESPNNIEDSFLAATQKIVSGVFRSTIKAQNQQKADYESQKTCDNQPKTENVIVQKIAHNVLEEFTDKVITESSTVQDKNNDTQKLVADVFQVLNHTSAVDISKSQEKNICDTAIQKVSSENYMKPTQVIFNPNTTSICDAVSQKISSDVFMKPTQKMPLSTLEPKKDIVEASIQNAVKWTVLPCNDDANVDNAATQKVSSDVFQKPTQGISRNIMESDEDFFTAPTQKVIFKPTVTLMEDDEEVYNVATQKVFSDIFMKPIQDMSIIKSGKDVLDIPTQTVTLKSNVTPIDGDEDVYNEATQKVSSDIFMKPTQKRSFIESDKDIFKAPTIDDEENVYDAATQKIALRTSESHKNGDDIFDASTQKVSVFKTGKSLIHGNEVVYDIPHQKICEAQKANKDIYVHKPALSSVVNSQENEDVYDSPTQKISLSVEILRQKGDETFLAPIQKVSTWKKSTKWDGELCTKPVQNIVSNSAENEKELDVHSVPPRNAVTEDEDDIKEVELKRDENLSLIKDEKNQEDVLRIVKDPIPQNDYQKGSSTEQNAFSEAQIEDSVQKSVDPSTGVVEVPSRAQLQTEKKKIKKSFSFKKTPCNLDASLSVLSNESKVSAKSLLDETASESSNMRQHSLENLITNSSHWDVNQSMALAESKMSKTRKVTKGTKITVSVPKNRQSLTIAKPKIIEEQVEERLKKGKNARKPSEVKPVRGKARIQEHNDGERCVSIRSVRKKIVKSEIEDNQVVPEKFHEKAKNSKDNLDSQSRRQDLNKTNTVKSENGNEALLECTTLARQTSKRFKITSQEQSHSSSFERDTSCKEESAFEDIMKKGRKKRKKTVEEEFIVVASPPKKLKTQSMPNTPQRGLRRPKPKVVFTMLESPLLESLIKQLGGRMVFSIETCSVLITEHVKRSQKLLAAIGLGKPICSPTWITDSKKNHEFLDPWDYILTDPEAEQKWDFSLRESLNRSQAKKLFNSYSFHIQVTAGVDVLKGTIEACGGKCLPKIPSGPLENAYVISLKENQGKYSRIVKRHPHFKVIEPEAIFDAALRQELRFSRHILT
ncbi:fap1 adhesin-like [Euwallacea similis]|uniref:fap1 adhesin-like n=1 Tax=Euwallacea similis TaxID=1736056 RepID=UPI00344B5035